MQTTCGAVERLLHRFAHGRVAAQRKPGRVLGGTAPDAQLRVRQHGPHRVDVRASLHARAEDRDDRRVRPCQRAGCDRGDRGRANLGDRAGVEQRAQLPGDPVVEQHGALVRVEPARRVPRRDDDLLEREHRRPAAAPGRHQAEQLVGRRADDERGAAGTAPHAPATRAPLSSPRCTTPCRAPGARPPPRTPTGSRDPPPCRLALHAPHANHPASSSSSAGVSDEVEPCPRVLEVRHATRADDDRGDLGLMQEPGSGDRGHRGAAQAAHVSSRSSASNTASAW